MAHDVFISYSAQDKSIADAVCAALEARQIRCWIAPRDVLPGQDYAEALIEAINGSRAMTLVLSSNSNNSPHVMREVERAASKGIPILPLRIEDVTPSKSMEYFISRTHWLDALTPPLEKHLERLAETLGLLLSGDERSHRVGGGGGELEAHGATATTDVPIQELPHQMEQHIRFCTTSDGVSIAYATLGQGPPLVVAWGWIGHLQFEWKNPEGRAFLERLAQGRLLVRYNKRGTGLSDWDAKDLSMEGWLRDLEAVVDTLGLERFALMGVSEGGATAVLYTSRHPERVSRLILYGAFHRYPHPREIVGPLLALVRAQWGLGSAALASAFVPDGDPAKVAIFTEYQRVSATGETAAKLSEVNADIDVTSLVKDIQLPTLVVHRRHDRVCPFGVAREMAALIPGARLEPLEGDDHVPFWGNSEAILHAIDRFLQEGEASAQTETPVAPSGPPKN